MYEGIHSTAFASIKQQMIDYLEDSIKDDIAEGEEDIEWINRKHKTIEKFRTAASFERVFSIMIDDSWDVDAVMKVVLKAYGCAAVFPWYLPLHGWST